MIKKGKIEFHFEYMSTETVRQEKKTMRQDLNLQLFALQTNPLPLCHGNLKILNLKSIDVRNPLIDLFSMVNLPYPSGNAIF